MRIAFSKDLASNREIPEGFSEQELCFGAKTVNTHLKLKGKSPPRTDDKLHKNAGMLWKNLEKLSITQMAAFKQIPCKAKV